MASVKVAVRVRPFNTREIGMNALSIIEMDGKKTRICNNKALTLRQDSEGSQSREKYKDFTFDYSYWSFDGQDPEFASQEQVFKDLGMDVVGNAFQGYNACVFAYGQTGSGKTHTMMGTQTPQESQGLIPRICKDMFNRMFQGKENGTTYRTEVSYLEIYNESVKDLLQKDQTHSLRVREHPKQGPYVDNLSKHLVMDYADIQGIMNRGNANRTTACTNMNDVSSRSHAIFTMTFVQASFVGDMPSETVSKVHLVDLAGSERADTSGATGQRLKEGAHINKSLVTLGSVISALAESSQAQLNKNSLKSTFIPYRDSVLTWLLKDSLGGNSKTIMIATISPADCNYGETLSTLRYANRAKNIINKPTINEDTNVKLIRELRAEINKLKLLLGSNVNSIDVLPEVLEELHKKEAKEKSLTEEWTEKWKETQKILLEQKDLALRKAGTGVVLDSQMPHLIGIDDDLLSTGITLYHLKQGETKIGSEGGNEMHDIMLNGLGLEAQHCSIMLESGIATLVPFKSSICWVNGQQIDKPTRLSQGCVILLGRTSMFRYNDPAEAEKLRRDGSRSHLNLSRLSFLSRSATDLAWSSENLNSTALGEENTLLEEKRKQLEAEEARLQKESQELLQQKQQLEQQKNTYQQLQQEKEEAWKAEQLNKSTDIHLAQKELEERRHKLELEYAAHRRRLAEDWKRLEEQEQDTLANLQSKEADLKKRREFLEWEVDQEMEQIESEASKVDTLKESVENKQREVNKLTNQFNEELQKLLDKPNENLKQLLVIEDNEVQNFLTEHSKKIEEWKTNAIADLIKEKEIITEKLKELTRQIESCEDPDLLTSFNKECQKLQTDENKIMTDITNLTDAYKNRMDNLKSSSSLLKEYRDIYAKTNQEFILLNNGIDNCITNMNASEAKISKLESDLALIADQEKLIVSQLANIDNSKQKLLTIIENSTEGLESELQDNGKKPFNSDLISREIEARYNQNTSSGNLDNKLWNISSSKPASNDLINEINGNNIEKSLNNSGESADDNRNETVPYDDILQVISPPPSLYPTITNEEAAAEINRLFQEVSQQKAVVLECLENDCEKEELNKHLEHLQDLINRYNVSRENAKVRQEWINFDEDDSSTLFDFEKNGDTTLGVESELDDSEAHSSVTDHEDHIQMLVDQEVERRLRQIIEQLKSGQKPDLLRGAGMTNRSFRRSMPSGLNTYASGSDDDGSTFSGNHTLPRSHSVNSASWAALNLKEGAIPGFLDIRISSYCQRGSGVSTHFQYEILIVTQNDRWTILRRYNRFRDLYKQMRKKYGLKVEKIPFPPKVFFGRKSEDVARRRQGSLETFLQSLIRICSSMPTCPLYKCESHHIKDALIAFSSFFEKGFFESTKYGTS